MLLRSWVISVHQDDVPSNKEVFGMALIITTNVASLNAQRNLDKTNRELNRSLARLSSGYRINTAADDPAGLAISEHLLAEIKGMQQDTKNAHDGVSLVQVAEGGLNTIQNMLIRLRELGVEASSDTVDNTDRRFLDVEYQQMKSEIQRVAEVTTFNGYDLLNGTGGVLDIQVGVHNDPFLDRISFNTAASDATLAALGLGTLSVSSKAQAQESLDAIDNALTSVSAMRANFGAMQNRLQSTISNLLIARENLSAANSRIRDTDVAAETARLTRAEILRQAGISVLQQANNQSQMVLKLLS